jgi:hypothetical protein
MFLKDVIKFLSKLDPDYTFKNGFGRVYGYGGSSDIAFEPAENVKVSEMLAEANWAIGKRFATGTDTYSNIICTATGESTCHVAAYGKQNAWKDDSMSRMFIEELLAMVNPKYV